MVRLLRRNKKSKKQKDQEIPTQQSGYHDFNNQYYDDLNNPNTVENFSQERRAASDLRREQQPVKRSQRLSSNAEIGIKATRAGMRFSKKGLSGGYNSTSYKAMGHAGAAFGAFAEGRGVKGAAKDVAVREAKLRATKALVTKLGLEGVAAPVGAVLQGRALGKGLRAKAAENKNWPYMIMLVVALTKDLMDIFSVELLSLFDWVFDLMIWAMLFFFLYGQGTAKVRMLTRVIGWFEVIPGIGILPVWTIAVLYAWKNKSDYARKQEQKADDIDRSVKRVETLGQDI